MSLCVNHKAVVNNILIINFYNFKSYSTSELVTDVSVLFNHVFWNKHCSFSEIIDQYCYGLCSNYGLCSEVFDSYGNHAITKDYEHHQPRKEMSFLYVKIELKTITQISRDIFLSHRQYICQLTSFLGKHPKKGGHLSDEKILIVKLLLELVV